MARIAYPDDESLSAHMRDQFRGLEVLNVTRIMSHNEGVLAAVARLGSELLERGTLPPQLRELVILRVACLCGSAYERHQHQRVARSAGVNERKLAAVESGDMDVFGAEERLALRFAEQIVARGAADAATLEESREHFTNAQLVELCILTGFYTMIAAFLATFDVEIESEPTDYRPGTLGGRLHEPRAGTSD